MSLRPFLMDAAGVLVAWIGARFLAHPRNPWRILDIPNERSLHVQPVPRTGGFAILGGAMVASLGEPWTPSPALAVIMGALCAIALLSWYDDRRGLSPRLRLIVHAAAALAVAALLAPQARGWLPGVDAVLASPLAIPFVAIFLVWWINLYNFMDGMDGFAGGMAVFGFGTLSLLGHRAHDPAFAEVTLGVASAAFGFTVSNFPPARLFMGDVGATVLGFLAGILILVGSARGDFPLWVGLVAFSPFLVDATVTLLKRAARGERLSHAHREHYYQRLVRAGFSHRQTVLAEYALMAICGLGAYGAVGASVPVQWAIIAALAALYSVLAALVRRWEGHGQASGKAAR
ncbi:MAG: MraY family glycosyltransferase [Acidiferrobacter sp.]